MDDGDVNGLCTRLELRAEKARTTVADSLTPEIEVCGARISDHRYTTREI